MANESHYNSGLVRRAPKPVNAPDSVEYHIDLVVKHTRRLFEFGHTIEEVLDLVLAAARAEFQCRIVTLTPACIRIDDHDYQWPLSRKD